MFGSGLAWEAMRRSAYLRAVAAAVLLAAVLMPTALCFGAVSSSPHPCCMQQESAWQDGGTANRECCFVNAPAPQQAAAITSSDPGARAAMPAPGCSEPIAPAAQQAVASDLSAEPYPPGLTSKTILRV
jgi:hypothetical protein